MPAVFAAIMFLTCFASAQAQGGIDEACRQAANETICGYISSEVSSQVSQTAPPGVNASCIWSNGVCSAVLSIPEEFGEHDTSIESLSAACAHGNSNQMICGNISSMISSSGQNPAGVAVSCVWNNPGARNNCSEHVVLDSSALTGKIAGGIIKTMSFIQNGAEATQVVVRSDPFTPYYIHVTIDGSLFPGKNEAQVWMRVNSIKDITPTEFNFSSIDPSAISAAEQSRIYSKFQSQGGVEIGPGIGPDFSALKAVQTFTWNMSIPYNFSMEFAGVANCNGTFNSSVNICQNAGEPAEWIAMPECTSIGNCLMGHT